MSWLYLFLFLVLLCVPAILIQWLKNRRRKRAEYWFERRDPHSFYDRMTQLLRSPKPAPPLQPSSPEPRDRIAASASSVVAAPTGQEQDWLKPKHRRNVEIAVQVLELLRLQTQPMDSKEALKIVIGSLRRVDPFVFEELLLQCFKDAGWQIVRNKRYTGDDGIDGRIYRDGQLYLVQAKRYTGLINVIHLRHFEQVVHQYGAAGGFFLHTGRTGNTAKAISQQQAQVTLLSGVKLVDFVLGRGKFVALAQSSGRVVTADDDWTDDDW